MSCLIEIHRAAPPVRAMYDAARRHAHSRSVCLVHTITSGRAAEFEAGKRLLLEAARALHTLDRELLVSARLEVGDPVERLLAVAEEIEPRLLVVSAHGEGEFPRLEVMGRTARAVLDWGRLPMVLVSPAGHEYYRLRRRRVRGSRATASPSGASRRLAPSLQTPAASL